MKRILGFTLIALLAIFTVFPAIALATALPAAVSMSVPNKVTSVNSTLVNSILVNSILVNSILVNSILVNSTSANGAALFAVHCAGCHINGSNIVRRGKNLQLKTLQKNGYDRVEAIAEITINGKNNMSAYGDRLTPSEIAAVSAYVLQQAQNNWKSPRLE